MRVDNNTAVYDFSVGHILTCEDLGELIGIEKDGSALAEAMRKSHNLSGSPRYYELARASMWAMWKAGAVLRAAEQGKRGPKVNSQPANKLKLSLLKKYELQKDTAYRWEAISYAPRDEVEKYMEQRETAGQPFKKSEVLKIGKKHRPVDLPLIGDDFRIIHDDLIDADIPDESIDCIITDPPYPKEFIGEYAKLSQFAARVLKPGGSCLAMAGQSYLPEVMSGLAEHLTYHWAVAYLTPGGQAVQQWDRSVNTFWKPVLWYVKGKFEGEWVGDVIKSDVNDNDKRFHHWGQSESGMARLVERFSKAGDVICDPFVGGGTTAIAALSRGRQFIGIDRDKEAVGETLTRLDAFNADR
jgi:16S rRNA G966 N2-methylase RsmD